MNRKEFAIELAAFVDNEIEKRGLVKSKACQAMGFSTATLSYWRKGIYFPTQKSVDAVENYFGVKFRPTEDSDEVIEQLQILRDDVRGLLDVQRDMTPEQVKSMMEFAKFLKSQGGRDAD